MAKKSKKFAAMLLSLAMIGMLAGCSSAGENPPPADQTTPETNQQGEVSNDNNQQPANENQPMAPVDLYAALQENEVIPYTLNEKATQFLSEHSDLFPLTAAEESTLSNYLDTSIEARQIEQIVLCHPVDPVADSHLDLLELQNT